MSQPLRFVKGHGTENDFVLLPDPDGELDLTPERVRAIADRRAGLGADGVIRVVRTAQVPELPEVAALAGEAEWFMDYRNADGSPAEMCGNGTRVLVQHLRREGLVDGTPFALATRAGVKRVRVEPAPDGEAGGDWVATDLGAWRVPGGDAAVAAGGDAQVTVRGLPGRLAGLSLDLGNPHTVVLLPDLAALSAADLTAAPDVDPLPPHGSNTELVVLHGLERGQGALTMRVFERGVGETRSCGTGAAAAALAARAWARAAAVDAGDDPGAVPDTWRVDVPGGRLRVTAVGDRVELAGPAVLVAEGTTTL